MKNFLDFDLSIDSTKEGYRARLLSSPAGQGTCEFNNPFSQKELEDLVIISSPRAVRKIPSPQNQAVQNFGKRLYNSVFAESVGDCLTRSLDIADAQGAGLRIRLRLSGAPQLADLPWEFLYSPSRNKFFALSGKTPIVRFLELPENTNPLRVVGPVRILIMVSNPIGPPPLDVEKEYQNLTTAMADLCSAGKVILNRLPKATMDCLQRTLRQHEFHIFHFIGHGGYRFQSDEGVLLLENSMGYGREVTGEMLGTIFNDYDSLRLAVLNACEGARNGTTDPFSGVAQNLVQKGLPAVIAMQFEISDNAAITFAKEFYSVLSESRPVETALAEARRIIYGQDHNVEWATPVLYLRADDGLIFNVEKALFAEDQRNTTQVAEVKAEEVAVEEERLEGTEKVVIEKKRLEGKEKITAIILSLIFPIALLIILLMQYIFNISTRTHQKPSTPTEILSPEFPPVALKTPSNHSKEQKSSPFVIQLLKIASMQVGVLENPSGSNKGPVVSLYLREVGLPDGVGWSTAFIYWCFERAAKSEGLSNPLPKTGSSLELWQMAEDMGAQRVTQHEAEQNQNLVVPGMIFVMDFGGGRGHSGIVESVNGLLITTIEGNINISQYRKGDGVYRRIRKIAEINKGFIAFTPISDDGKSVSK